MNVSKITLSKLTRQWCLITTACFIHKDDVGTPLRTGTPLKMGLSAAPFTWWPLGDFLFLFTSLTFPCRKLSLPTSVHIPAGACTNQSGLANRAHSEVECPWLKYTCVSPLAGGALDTDFFNSTSCNPMCLRVRSQELISPMLLTLHKERCWLLANPS